MSKSLYDTDFYCWGAPSRPKRCPSLKPKRPELFARAYVMARKEAAIETKRAIGLFPQDPPFTVGAIESDEYWPTGFPIQELQP